ncbi:carbohydrate ABC transporter permease [Microbacterium saccharophilum]|uniref:Carbohydrate ABC transporter permease n=1 Tax=Microbacterium saccharophilum TaxID=1213358 RepID=A0A5C8HVM1_9MICO|nr:carbohydrate ABC transporter permease [Microbacterium saccharophilum]TXK08947.1 carbohydrate ABC transporter permease [Microbacterium saccharophilum]GEP48023.1 sugar ABC transporter permease [Microbacterium saccharophilum]
MSAPTIPAGTHDAAADHPAHRRRPGRRLGITLGAVAYLVTFLIVLPLLWILLLSFQPSGNILGNPLAFDNLTFDNYINAITGLPLLRMYANTIFIAVASVTIGTAISFMAAFALTRMVFRRRRAQSSLRLYLLAGLAVPVYILLFPVYRLDLTLGIFGTYWALILPYIAVTIPFNILLMTGFLREFPTEIEEAAIIDGVGLWKLCWTVVLPLMRPVIATILIFNVVYVFNEFPFASILINDPDMVTVSLAVSRFQGQYTVDYGGMMAAATLVLVPQLIIYALFQRQVIAGMTVGAVKG